jgi:hypothetical protein
MGEWVCIPRFAERDRSDARRHACDDARGGIDAKSPLCARANPVYHGESERWGRLPEWGFGIARLAYLACRVCLAE